MRPEVRSAGAAPPGPARLSALWFLAARLLEAAPARAAGLVFAVAFSTLLTAHQLSMFVGILRRTSSLVDDVEDAELWVMDPAGKDARKIVDHILSLK